MGKYHENKLVTMTTYLKNNNYLKNKQQKDPKKGRLKIISEMERAKTTKANDAVTLRQFRRFLSTAKLPARRQVSVESLQEVI